MGTTMRRHRVNVMPFSFPRAGLTVIVAARVGTTMNRHRANAIPLFILCARVGTTMSRHRANVIPLLSYVREWQQQ